MSLTVETSGPTTTTPGSEQSIFTSATAKIYTLRISIKNLTSSESLTVNVYDPVQSGGADELIATTTFLGSDSQKHVQTFGFTLVYGGKFKILQPSGSARICDWTVVSF
jgi:hypothetical protein